MTPEEKSMLERSLKLSEENNKILHSMRRSARISSIMRYVYWVIIIGLSLGAYYLIQPYVNTLLHIYGQIEGKSDATQSLSTDLDQLFK